jgi:hypothetical protein
MKQYNDKIKINIKNKTINKKKDFFLLKTFENKNRIKDRII